MIHVPRLKDKNAAKLFLGFRVGTIGSCHFAVLPIQGQGGFRALKRFATTPVPAGAKMVVVSQTDVFHCSSPHSGLAEPAAERCTGSFNSSLLRVFRGCSGQVVYLLPPGPCVGAGKKRSSRTSPTASQEMEPLRAHAGASSISAHSSIQNPPMCSLVSVYGPSVTTTLPSRCFRTVFALAAGEIPQANFLTPAAIISRLSAWISSIIASVTVDGSKSSGR